MKRKLVALMALLAGLSLAQSTPEVTQSHTITVKVVPVLRLHLDATNYLFDFDDPTTSGSVLGFPKASREAYGDFLDDESKTTQLFAPTSIGGSSNDYGTLRINTNQAQWTVKIKGITGNLDAPLANSRVKVHAGYDSGKGSSLTGTPGSKSLGANTAIIQATSNGQGRSVYHLYYFLEMNIDDAFPSAPDPDDPDYSYASTITVELALTTP